LPHASLCRRAGHHTWTGPHCLYLLRVCANTAHAQTTCGVLSVIYSVLTDFLALGGGAKDTVQIVFDRFCNRVLYFIPHDQGSIHARPVLAFFFCIKDQPQGPLQSSLQCCRFPSNHRRLLSNGHHFPPKRPAVDGREQSCFLFFHLGTSTAVMRYFVPGDASSTELASHLSFLEMLIEDVAGMGEASGGADMRIRSSVLSLSWRESVV